jgi:hypothetical protein
MKSLKELFEKTYGALESLLHLHGTLAPQAHTGVWCSCFELRVHSAPLAYLSLLNRPSRTLLVLLSSLDYHFWSDYECRIFLNFFFLIAYPTFKPFPNFQLGFRIHIHIFKTDKFLDLPKNIKCPTFTGLQIW